MAFNLASFQSLTSCQINENKRAKSFVVIFLAKTFEPEGNNQVRSAWPFVHVCRCFFSVYHCFLHVSQHLLYLTDFHFNTLIFLLGNIICFDQVYNILEVDLLNWKKSFEIPSEFSALLYLPENQVHTPISESSMLISLLKCHIVAFRAKKGESFAWTCLSICKNAYIFTIDSTLNKLW